MLEINFVNTSCLPTSGVSAVRSLKSLPKSNITFATPWSDPLNKASYYLFLYSLIMQHRVACHQSICVSTYPSSNCFTHSLNNHNIDIS